MQGRNLTHLGITFTFLIKDIVACLVRMFLPEQKKRQVSHSPFILVKTLLGVLILLCEGYLPVLIFHNLLVHVTYA